MGRRKIEIKSITNERNRSVTFLKRKNGLFKKAYELGVLCSVDVAVIIFGGPVGQKYKLYEYCSGDIDKIVKKRLNFSGERDAKGPEDFGDKDKDGGAGDDDDDDDSDAPRAGPSSKSAKVSTKGNKAGGSGNGTGNGNGNGGKKASAKGAGGGAVKSDDDDAGPQDITDPMDLAMDVEPLSRLQQAIYPPSLPLPVSGERHHHHHHHVHHADHPHKRPRRDSNSTSSSQGYGQYPAPPAYNTLDQHQHHHHHMQPTINPPQAPLAALFQHRPSIGNMSNSSANTIAGLGLGRVSTAPPTAPPPGQLPMNVSINISRELMDAFGLSAPPPQQHHPHQHPQQQQQQQQPAFRQPPPIPIMGAFEWPSPAPSHQPPTPAPPERDTTWLDIFGGGGGAASAGGTIAGLSSPKKESPPVPPGTDPLVEFFGNVAALAGASTDGVSGAGASAHGKRRWDGS